MLHALDRLPEGEASTREAAELLGALVQERPDDHQTRAILARGIVNLGSFARLDRPELAMAEYQRAIEQWEILCQPATAQPGYLEWYARTLSDVGHLLLDKGNALGSLPFLTEARSRAEQLHQLVPKEKGALDCAAACRTNLGEALTAANRAVEALPVLEGALEAYREEARKYPDETEGLWGTAMVQTDIGDALSRLNRWAEAVPPLEAAGATYHELSKVIHDDPVFKDDMEKHRQILARVQTGAAGPKH
jgi:tetratricopeptide (TPR) repeat protein